MQDHVYKGIWIDHGEPIFSRWKWTLTNSEGICILALFTTLLTCTQGQAWIILRRLAHRWLYQAAAPPGENRRTNPSQGDATLDLVQFIGWKANELVIRRVGGRVIHQARNLSSHPIFGTVALFNAFTFIAMGVAIPYLLSEGGMSAPMVRSKGGPNCRYGGLGTYSIRTWDAIQQSAIESDLIGRLCWEAPGRAYCPAFALPWKMSSHGVDASFSSKCPFQESVCTGGGRPITSRDAYWRDRSPPRHQHSPPWHLDEPRVRVCSCSLGSVPSPSTRLRDDYLSCPDRWKRHERGGKQRDYSYATQLSERPKDISPTRTSRTP